MKLALAQENYVTALTFEALRLVEEDKALCDNIATTGAKLITRAAVY